MTPWRKDRGTVEHFDAEVRRLKFERYQRTYREACEQLADAVETRGMLEDSPPTEHVFHRDQCVRCGTWRLTDTLPGAVAAALRAAYVHRQQRLTASCLDGLTMDEGFEGANELYAYLDDIAHPRLDLPCFDNPVEDSATHRLAWRVRRRDGSDAGPWTYLSDAARGDILVDVDRPLLSDPRFPTSLVAFVAQNMLDDTVYQPISFLERAHAEGAAIVHRAEVYPVSIPRQPLW